MNDDKVREICTNVLWMAGYIKSLQSIVDQLPKTADGLPVFIGRTIYCPRGHKHVIHASNRMSGQIYCTEKGCWSEGCQSDSGSGTHYEARECRGEPPLAMPWASACEIFPKAEREIWVRFTGADGIYWWLHPIEKRWVGEPEQTNMPMFVDYTSARAAADASPEPPTWSETVYHAD